MRVDAREGYAEKIGLLQAQPDYDAFIAVRHKGDKGENPHYHIVIKTAVKDQAFRVRMKKKFDQGKGNGHMSIKSWDGNIDAISYLFHETEDCIVASKNVSDELIEQAKARNREVQEKVAKAKDRASWKLEDVVYERLVGQEVSEYEIALEIVKTALRSDKYMPNDFLLKAMARKIKFRLLDHDLDKEDAYARHLVASVYRMDSDQAADWLAGGGRGVALSFGKTVAPLG